MFQKVVNPPDAECRRDCRHPGIPFGSLNVFWRWVEFRELTRRGAEAATIEWLRRCASQVPDDDQHQDRDRCFSQREGETKDHWHIRSFRLQTFVLSLKFTNVERFGVSPIAGRQGFSAMRDTNSSGEKTNVQRRYLTADEARRVIDAAAKVGRQGERDKLLLTLIFRHGLRVSEAVDLRWSDFDLDAGRGARTAPTRWSRTACVR
jgi:integrase